MTPSGLIEASQHSGIEEKRDDADTRILDCRSSAGAGGRAAWSDGAIHQWKLLARQAVRLPEAATN